MKKNFKNLLLVLILTPFISFAACKGTSPAGPPAPPAEIPGFVVFPDSLDVGGTNSSASISSVQASQIVGKTKDVDTTLLSALIKLGGELQEAVLGFVAAKDTDDIDGDGDTDETIGVLAAYSDLKIPTDPNLKYCEFNSTEGKCYQGDGSETSTAPIGNTSNTVFISFADFDLNGDGSNEGCTGNSCPVDCTDADIDCSAGCPVDVCEEDCSVIDCNVTCTAHPKDICMRLWSSDTTAATPITDILPTLAVRMDQIPCYVDSGSLKCLERDADTTGKDLLPGQGAYRAKVITADDGTNDLDVVQEAGVTYDHRSSDDSKSTDVVLKTTNHTSTTDSAIDSTLGVVEQTSWIRGIVFQDETAAGVGRVKVSADYFLDTDGVILDSAGDATDAEDWLTYISRLLTDRTLWSGFSSSAAGDLELNGTCAEQTGTAFDSLLEEWTDLLDDTECQSADIDVDDLNSTDTGVAQPTIVDHAISDNDLTGTLPNTVDFPAVGEFPEDYCTAHSFTGC
jgi:hypothetical protein